MSANVPTINCPNSSGPTSSNKLTHKSALIEINASKYWDMGGLFDLILEYWSNLENKYVVSKVDLNKL